MPICYSNPIAKRGFVTRFTFYVSHFSSLPSERTGQGYGPVLLSLFLMVEVFRLVYV